MILVSYVLVFIISTVCALLQNESSINAFVYLNIAQTGGIWLGHQIPIILNLTSCNNVFHIRSSGSFADHTYGLPPTSIDRLRYPVFGQSCSFFNYEFNRSTMNRLFEAIGYAPSKYMVLSSFREPCSHFFAVLYTQLHLETLMQH